MPAPEAWRCLLVLILATGLDIVCNLMLKKSSGFKHKGYGVCALLFMVGALSGMVYAVTGLPVAVAWGLWASLGVFGTGLGGWLFFAQKIRLQGWAGMAILFVGMVMLYAG